VRKLTAPKTRQVTVGLAGKYAHLRDAYASIDKALEHCSAHLSCRVEQKWIESTDLHDRNVAASLAELDAVIVPGGFGSRGVEGKIACVKYCREQQVPYLGICLGFQVAVIEFARNVLGIKEASSTEFDPASPHPVINELPEQKKIEGLGGTMRLGGQDVLIQPGTLAHFLFGNRSMVRERFRHRYEVDPAYVERLEQGGLVFSGRHPTRPIMQVLELRRPEGSTGVAGKPAVTHPFFIGGQFHPELTSRPLRPQPMFLGLVAAALRRKYGAGQVGATAFEVDLAKLPAEPVATA
jgi:CTP synthase